VISGIGTGRGMRVTEIESDQWDRDWPRDESDGD